MCRASHGRERSAVWQRWRTSRGKTCVRCPSPRRGWRSGGAENPRGTGYTLLLGVVAEDQGDYDAALPLLEEALTIFQETGYQALAAQTSYHLGVVTHGQPTMRWQRHRLQDTIAEP